MIFEHKSVLLMETVDSLNVKPDGIYVDGTLGGGGHAYEVSRRLGEKGRLIGIDQDADAIAAATERLLPFKDKVTIVRSNYKNIREVLFNLGIEKVDGIYLDLGVSSYQLDTADRGFSYREDAPLDMRMDQRNDKTAADIVNGYSEMELYRIIRDYGEDRFAKNIAKHIVREREIHPIETTLQLAEIIRGAIPAKIRAEGGHPAKRTFQAIRIELNHELDVLNDSIDTMIDLLNPGASFLTVCYSSTILRSRPITSTVSCTLLTAHMIVSSPAIHPTTSCRCMASSAAATAIAIPDTVLITRIFCAISMETNPSRNTLVYFSDRSSLASISATYFCLPPLTATFVSFNSRISLETVACVT